MGMEQELGSLQPWQIFSALYLGFWSLSCYFDHFLMTFVFCLAFGVMSEIATRYMNGDHLASSPASAKEMEAGRMAVSRAEPVAEQLFVSKDDLKDLLAEDDGPPPLPAKDYLPEPEEIMDTDFEESNEPGETVTSTSFNATDPFLEAARSTELQSATFDRLSETELTSDDSMRAAMASSTYVNIDSSQDNLDDFSIKDDFEDTLAADTIIDSKNDANDDKKDEVEVKEETILSSAIEEPILAAKESSIDAKYLLDLKDPVEEIKESLIDTSEPLIATKNDSFKVSNEPLVDTTLDSLVESTFDDRKAMNETHDSSKGLVEPLDIKDLIAEADSSKNLGNESLLDFSAPPPPEESSPSPNFATSTTHNLLEDFVETTADSKKDVLDDFGASATKDLLVKRSFGEDDGVEVLGDIKDVKKDIFDDEKKDLFDDEKKDLFDDEKKDLFDDVKKDYGEDRFAENVKKDDGKLYAPDSSSDEELEAEYANREVNLEESESEEENGGYEFKRGDDTKQNGASYETKRGISPGINDSSPEEGPQEHLSSEDSDSPIKSSPVHQGDEPVSKGLSGTRALLDDSSSTQHSNSEIDDIDLSDPQLEMAATKIQSVFKGFQARKKMSNS